MREKIILAIESSCDDTGVAIISADKKILSNIVISQLKEHEPYSGVVPEIAARSHMLNLKTAVKKALEEARMNIADIDAIAATTGPGLIGGVIVGTMFAKGLAAANNKPFIAVNHLEGHALTVRLTSDVSFPYLLLLVSGGHCQFLSVFGVGKYKILGQTLDDAVGEAFDKIAKLLKLGFPGGPIIESLAKAGDPKRYELPLSMTTRPGCDLSFSGLKTAVRLLIEKQEVLSGPVINDICASFQYTIGEILARRTINAIGMFDALGATLLHRDRHGEEVIRPTWPSSELTNKNIAQRAINVVEATTLLDCHGANAPRNDKKINHATKSLAEGKSLVLAGGVASNLYLRSRLEEVAKAHNLSLEVPPVSLCTDNAAMIAWAGHERLRLGLTDGLDTCPKARWSLEDL